jgi:hypothetical protein
MVWHDRRTVGYYFALPDAIDCIEHNRGDLEEAGWYRWAVIDQVPEGLYGIGGEKMDPIWFEYVGDDRWERIDVSPNTCPAEIKQAMGGFERIFCWASLG